MTVVMENPDRESLVLVYLVFVGLVLGIECLEPFYPVQVLEGTLVTAFVW